MFVCCFYWLAGLFGSLQQVNLISLALSTGCGVDASRVVVVVVVSVVIVLQVALLMDNVICVCVEGEISGGSSCVLPCRRPAKSKAK